MGQRQGLVGLVLVGGAGTRLWPLSSEDKPKQFLRLFDAFSLFQTTLARIAPAVDDLVVVTAAAYASLVREQVAELAGPRPTLLLEPVRRDSAAAISAGIAWIGKTIGPDAVVAVLPADHHIPDVAAFTDALAQGRSLAAENWLVTFGIRPTFPSTEYGYIQRGAAIARPCAEPAFRVAQFHEKPKREVAEGYLRAGNCDWNSGIFMFGARTFAEEAALHMSDVWQPAMRAVEAARDEGHGLLLAPESFAAARKSSIDYALFENSKRVAVVPVSFEWHDIGNWDSCYQAFSAGPDSNLVMGEAALEDVSGSLVLADGVKVVLCGLDDVVVVASPRGTFVAARSRAAEIKRLIAD